MNCNEEFLLYDYPKLYSECFRSSLVHYYPIKMKLVEYQIDYVVETGYYTPIIMCLRVPGIPYITFNHHYRSDY
jgi:hypothetical protein